MIGFSSGFAFRRALPLLLFIFASGCATSVAEPVRRTFASPVEMVGKWPVTAVLVNGEALRFVIDTAAGGTIIDKKVAERLKLPAGADGDIAGATSASQAGTARAARLEVGGAVHENVEMLVTDMSQFPGNLAGILGNDVTRRYSLVLDVPGGRLELSEEDRQASRSAMACIPNARPNRDENLAGFTLVETDVKPSPAANPVPILMVIDSGASATYLNWAAARALGLEKGDPRLTERRAPRGINATAVLPSSYAFQLEGLNLAGWTVPSTPVRIFDLPVFETLGLASTPAAILGADILAGRAFGIAKGAAEFCVAGR